MRCGLSAVRVKMARAERQGRMCRQKSAGLRRKDIRVAPDFVNGPAGGAFLGGAGLTLTLSHTLEYVM
jgi:hypothetical protein